MPIFPATPENLASAAAALRAGEVVAMPTETVYGLAGAAFHPHALTTIFRVKERPTFDPLICHVPLPPAGTDWLVYLQATGLVDAQQLSDAARRQVTQLANRFWPGPLTLVLPKQPRVPDLATSGLPTVAVRSPRHPVAQALLQRAGMPLAAPSANRFGRISPTTAEHVESELGDRIHWILDGGPCEIGIESTVLLVAPRGELHLLRPGGASVTEIAAATGTNVLSRQQLFADSPLPSPGLLASHYAPRKPLRLLPRRWNELSDTERSPLASELASGARIGLLCAQQPPPLSNVATLTLSPAGDAAEAAHNLFAMLRALDNDPRVDQLWAEPMPGDAGLSYAINDRLQRASAR